MNFEFDYNFIGHSTWCDCIHNLSTSLFVTVFYSGWACVYRRLCRQMRCSVSIIIQLISKSTMNSNQSVALHNIPNHLFDSYRTRWIRGLIIQNNATVRNLWTFVGNKCKYYACACVRPPYDNWRRIDTVYIICQRLTALHKCFLGQQLIGKRSVHVVKYV